MAYCQGFKTGTGKEEGYGKRSGEKKRKRRKRSNRTLSRKLRGINLIVQLAQMQSAQPHSVLFRTACASRSWRPSSPAHCRQHYCLVKRSVAELEKSVLFWMYIFAETRGMSRERYQWYQAMQTTEEWFSLEPCRCRTLSARRDVDAKKRKSSNHQWFSFRDCGGIVRQRSEWSERSYPRTCFSGSGGSVPIPRVPLHCNFLFDHGSRPSPSSGTWPYLHHTVLNWDGLKFERIEKQLWVKKY